jgi:hypothetical protein
MATRLRQTWRIVPPRRDVFLGLVVAGWGLGLIIWLAVRGGLSMPLLVLLVVMVPPLLLLAAQTVAQLLPGSPGDYVEVSSDGITVGNLFGCRHRRWEDIERFSVSLVRLRGLPSVWVKAASARDDVRSMRFSMGGYVKLSWFDRLEERQEELRDWFENLRAAYLKGNRSGTFPQPPERFIGHMIEPPIRPRHGDLSAR